VVHVIATMQTSNSKEGLRDAKVVLLAGLKNGFSSRILKLEYPRIITYMEWK
jgi:hypothetical protein